jgi:PKD repeat protein
MYMKPISVSTRTLIGAALAVVLASAGCTMKNQEAPPLTGPSELGTSITITVTPDTLTQDGSSQSLVTITARDQNGNPLPNLALRAEIFVNFERVDFGSLSARSLVTDANGRATLVFTAPSSPAGPSVDNNTTVQIVVTPVGSDFGNSKARLATIRLVPPGGVVPADGLQPRFTFTPAAPEDHQTVFFDASSSVSPANNPIATFSWDFGDGGRSTGQTTTHSFNFVGTFVVTLTVTDGFNRSASATQTVTVGPGTGPSDAQIVTSPQDPFVGQTVNINASSVRPAPGRTLRTYEWDFGDGVRQTTASANTSHVWQTSGTFTITLTVTDDAGRSTVITQAINIRSDAPTADFGATQPPPTATHTIRFDPAGSSAIEGRTITAYFWDFGDGFTSNQATPTHSYIGAGSFNVTLTVTDSAGKTAQKTKTVIVQ